MSTHSSKSYLCAGSSSFDDPDVVEVSPAVATAAGCRDSGHQKRKRSQWEKGWVIPLNAHGLD